MGFKCSGNLLCLCFVIFYPTHSQPNEDLQDRCSNGDAQSCYDLAEDVEMDYTKLSDDLEQGCESGDIDTCIHIGYLLTKKSPRDYKRALFLFEEACYDGNMLGCYNEGVMYLNGHGTGRDPYIGKELLIQSCQGGYMAACNTDLRAGLLKGTGLQKKGVIKNNLPNVVDEGK